MFWQWNKQNKQTQRLRECDVSQISFPTSRQPQTFKASVAHFSCLTTSNVCLIPLHKTEAIIWESEWEFTSPQDTCSVSVRLRCQSGWFRMSTYAYLNDSPWLEQLLRSVEEGGLMTVHAVHYRGHWRWLGFTFRYLINHSRPDFYCNMRKLQKIRDTRCWE